jgi:hypothetical protein
MHRSHSTVATGKSVIPSTKYTLHRVQIPFLHCFASDRMIRIRVAYVHNVVLTPSCFESIPNPERLTPSLSQQEYNLGTLTPTLSLDPTVHHTLRCPFFEPDVYRNHQTLPPIFLLSRPVHRHLSHHPPQSSLATSPTRRDGA